MKNNYLLAVRNILNSSNITGTKGFYTSLGGDVRLGGENFNVSLSTMQYFTGETSQRTGTIGIGSGDFSFAYENDYHVFGLTDKLHISDGSGRFRTAALRIAYDDLSIGFNLFTGDPGKP